MASRMEGMVMKENAAVACFMDLSLVPDMLEARVLTCLTREDCTRSKCEYLFLEILVSRELLLYVSTYRI